MSFWINSYLLALQAYCFSHLYAVMLVFWCSKVTFGGIIFGKSVYIRTNSEITGWTVRGSNPSGGLIFRTPTDRLCGPPSLIFNGYWDFPGSKAAGAW
jgi:hypothetical protein